VLSEGIGKTKSGVESGNESWIHKLGCSWAILQALTLVLYLYSIYCSSHVCVSSCTFLAFIVSLLLS
jgi:hypothetical protein